MSNPVSISYPADVENVPPGSVPSSVPTNGSREEGSQRSSTFAKITHGVQAVTSFGHAENFEFHPKFSHPKLNPSTQSKFDWDTCWQKEAEHILSSPFVVRQMNHQHRDKTSKNFLPAKERTGKSGIHPKLKEIIDRVKDKRLHDISKSRPSAAILYDSKNCYSSLATWSGTAIKMAALKYDFWALIFLHVGVAAFYHGYAKKETINRDVPYFEEATMLITGAFLAFFLVFFNSKAYVRFFQQYFITRRVEFAIIDLFILIRTHMDSPLKQLFLLRFLHAMHYLAYGFIDQYKDLKGFKAALWEHLERTKLLTHTEAKDLRLTQHIAPPNVECLCWMLRLVRAEMNEGRMRPPIFRAFESKLHGVNDNFEELGAYAQQPIPFAYYHLMVWVLEAYLVILAYYATFITPWYSIIGYLMTVICLLGLREASACLADPLGFDESDIPVFDNVAKLHFDQMMCLTMRPNKAIHHHLKPPLGFGGVDCVGAVLEGLLPSDYQAGGLLEHPVNETEPDKPVRPANEDQAFWDDLALGKFDDDLLKGAIAPPDEDPTPVDFDDDDDDFEDYD